MPSRGDSITKSLTRLHGHRTVFPSDVNMGRIRREPFPLNQSVQASSNPCETGVLSSSDKKQAIHRYNEVDHSNSLPSTQKKDPFRHPTKSMGSQTEDISPPSSSIAVTVPPSKDSSHLLSATDASPEMSPELQRQVFDLMEDVKSLQSNIYSAFGLDEFTPTSQEPLPEKENEEELCVKDSPRKVNTHPLSIFNLPSPDAKTLKRYFPNLSSAASSSSSSSPVKKKLEAINEYVQKFRKVLNEVEERQRILDDNLHLAKHRHHRQELYSVLSLMTSDPSAFTENLHIKQLVDNCISSVQAEIMNSVSEQLAREQQTTSVTQGLTSQKQEDKKTKGKTKATKTASRPVKKVPVSSTLTSRLRASLNSNQKGIKPQIKKSTTSKQLDKNYFKSEKSKTETILSGLPLLEVPDDDSIFDDVASIEWDDSTYQNFLPKLESAQQQYLNTVYDNLMDIRRRKAQPRYHSQPSTNPIAGDKSSNWVSAIPLEPSIFQPETDWAANESLPRDTRTLRGITAIPLQPENFRRPSSASQNSQNQKESISPKRTGCRKVTSAPPQKVINEKDLATETQEISRQNEAVIEHSGTEDEEIPFNEETQELQELTEDLQPQTESPKSPSKAVTFNLPQESSEDKSDDYSLQFDESSSTSNEKEETEQKKESTPPLISEVKEENPSNNETQIRTSVLLGLRKHPHSKKPLSATTINAGLFQYGTLLKIPPSLSPQRKTWGRKAARNSIPKENITQLRVRQELTRSKSLIEKCTHLLGIDATDSSVKNKLPSPSQTPIQNEELSEEQVSNQMESGSEKDEVSSAQSADDDNRRQFKNTVLFDAEDEFLLPGMSPVSVSYHGVPYPPSNVPPYPQVTIPTLRTNILPKEMKSTHQVLKTARNWIEQELLARALSLSEPENKPSSSSYNFIKKKDEARSRSPLVGLLGAEGIKLFMDAGQPVDELLIHNLVQEIISEEAVRLVQEQRLNAGCGTASVIKDKMEDQSEHLPKPPEMETVSTQTIQVNEKENSPPVTAVETPVPTPVPSPRTSPEPEVLAVPLVPTPSSSKESSDDEIKQSPEDISSVQPVIRQPANIFVLPTSNFTAESAEKIETPQPTPPTSPSGSFHLQRTPPLSEEEPNVLPSSPEDLSERRPKEEATQTSIQELQDLDIYPDRQARSSESNPLPSVESASVEKPAVTLNPTSDPEASTTNTSSVSFSEITDMTISEGEWWPANIDRRYSLLPFQNYAGGGIQRKRGVAPETSAVSGVSMDNTLLDADDLDQEPVSEGEVRLPFTSSRNAFLANLMQLQEKQVKENNDNEASLKTEDNRYRSPGEVSASLLPFPRPEFEEVISADSPEDYDLNSESENFREFSRVPSVARVHFTQQQRERKGKDERHVSFHENLNEDSEVPPADVEDSIFYPFGPDLQPAEPGLYPSQHIQEASFNIRHPVHPDTLTAGRKFSSSEDSRFASATKDIKPSFSTPSIQIDDSSISGFMMHRDNGQSFNTDHRLSQFSTPHLYPHNFHSSLTRTSTRPFLVTHQSERDLSYMSGLRRDLTVKEPRKSGKLEETSSSSLHTKHLSLEDAQPSTSRKRETSREVGSPGEIRSISKSSAASSQSEHAIRQSSDSHNNSAASSRDEVHYESGKSNEDFEHYSDRPTSNLPVHPSQSLDSVESGEIDLYVTAQGYLNDSVTENSRSSSQEGYFQEGNNLSQNKMTEHITDKIMSTSNEQLESQSQKLKKASETSVGTTLSDTQIESSSESLENRSSQRNNISENNLVNNAIEDFPANVSEDVNPSISSELSEGEIRFP